MPAMTSVRKLGLAAGAALISHLENHKIEERNGVYATRKTARNRPVARYALMSDILSLLSFLHNNPKSFDFGLSLCSARKEFPNFCRLMSDML